MFEAKSQCVIEHTGSSLSAATAFPTTAHIIPVHRNRKKKENRKYEYINIKIRSSVVALCRVNKVSINNPRIENNKTFVDRTVSRNSMKLFVIV